VKFGKRLRLNRLVAFVLLENRAMQTILERCGFEFKATPTGNTRQGQLLFSATSATYGSNEFDRVADVANFGRKLTGSLRVITAKEFPHQGTMVSDAALAA
jgi:RimJ/RimL family protein N-acetyltransferase